MSNVLYIPFPSFSLSINVSLLLYSLILIIIFRRYSFYMFGAYKLDALPEKLKLSKKIIDGVSVVFLIICSFLIVNVDSN